MAEIGAAAEVGRASIPERAHVIGCYALGKAQRVISLLRAGRVRRADLSPRRDDPRSASSTRSAASRSATLRPLARNDQGRARRARSSSRRRGAIKDRWSRRLPDPVLAVASGWMSVKQRARQSGVELPLVISDHADWNELRQTIADTGAETVWVTHGREDALVYQCQQQGLAGRAAPHRGLRGRRGGDVKKFAQLLELLALTPSRNRKIEALSQYFATTPDPDRGYALAILTGALTFKNVKPAMLRDVVVARGRSAPLRPELRLCRRPRRDHRADLAASRGAGGAAVAHRPDRALQHDEQDRAAGADRLAAHARRRSTSAGRW